MNEKKNYVLAIDVAKGKSMFFILSIHGEVILDAIEYEHTLSHFKMIDQIIGKEEIKDDLVVFMESTSTYHYPVMRYFIEQDYDVIVVNPNLVKKSSTTFRRTKTDRLDAIKIAETYFKEEIKSNAIKTGRLYDDLQAADRQLISLEKALTAIKNRYTRLLDICVPEHELFYSDKSDKYSLKYITLFEHFPHSEFIQKKRVDHIARILNLTFNRSFKTRLTNEATQLKNISKDAYPGVSITSNEVDNLKQTIIILKEFMGHYELAKARLIHLGKQTKEYTYVSSIPGIGDQTASQLIAEIGDFSRFRSYKQINAYCGIEPSIYQSGKTFYNGKITKSGNPFARKVLYSVIMNIIQSSRSNYPEHPINTYYTLKKEKENKSTKESVIASSTKLIRILFSLCKYKRTFTK
jgi:transposase